MSVEEIHNHVRWVIGLLKAEGSGDATAAACVHLLLNSLKKDADCQVSSSDCAEIVWERLHSGRWDQVPSFFREAYGASQLLLVQHSFQAGNNTESLRLLDLVLLMSGEHSRRAAHRLLPMIASSFPVSPEPSQSLSSSTSPHQGSTPGLSTHQVRGQAPPQSKRSNRLAAAAAPGSPPLAPPRHCGHCQSLQRVSMPSLSTFLNDHMNAQVPVIVTNAMAHWPACCDPDRSWRDLAYLKKKAGMRTVPVEIGDTYLSESWSQKLISFGEFVDRFVEGGDEGGEAAKVNSDAAAGDRDGDVGGEDGSGSERVSTRGKKSRGYLAQHQLFDQVPELRKDVCLPDYCSLLRADEVVPVEVQGVGGVEEGRGVGVGEGVSGGCGGECGERSGGGGGGEAGSSVGCGGEGGGGEGGEECERSTITASSSREVTLNAWFGPPGTVSPLHHDPRHNLLAQVVGSKYVCLFDHSTSHCLYAATKGLMGNNSQVDFEAPDLGRFPLFQTTKGFEGVLREGEMLYIPPLWWHFVKSLERSFSVSFWWGKERTMDERPQPIHSSTPSLASALPSLSSSLPSSSSSSSSLLSSTSSSSSSSSCSSSFSSSSCLEMSDEDDASRAEKRTRATKDQTTANQEEAGGSLHNPRNRRRTPLALPPPKQSAPR